MRYHVQLVKSRYSNRGLAPGSPRKSQVSVSSLLSSFRQSRRFKEAEIQRMTEPEKI